MNEIEQQQSDKGSRPVIIDYVIFVGIIILGYSLYDKINSVRVGPDLTTLKVSILDKPQYKDGGKSGTDRYELNTKEYNCKFWVAESALDIIWKNPTLKKTIEQLQTGDTIAITINRGLVSTTNISGQRIDVKGLRINQKVLIDPKEVEKGNDRSFWIKLIVSIAIIAAGTVWKMRHKKNSSV